MESPNVNAVPPNAHNANGSEHHVPNPPSNATNATNATKTDDGLHPVSRSILSPGCHAERTHDGNGPQRINDTPTGIASR